MKKKNVITIMAVAMLFAVSLYFVGGTYARYTSSFEGNATVKIAKWAVALKDGADAQNINLTLTATENKNVVADRIAPGVTVEGTVEINLEGTEVAVELKTNKDAIADSIAEKLTELGFETHAKDITVNVTLEKGKQANESMNIDGTKVALPGGAAFGINDTVLAKVTVEWTNADNTDHDAEHTKVGSEHGGEDLEIPVTLTVQQYLGA